MKKILFRLTLTVFCAALVCPPHSFAQRFIDGQMPDTFLNVGYSVGDIEFSPDGATIASWNFGRTVELWDAATGKLKATFVTSSPGGPMEIGFSAAFSPDGQMLASGSPYDIIYLWNPATGEHIRTLEGHTGWVNSAAFSPDGQMLASGSWDNTVILWDVATGTLKTTLEGHWEDVNSVTFSPDGQTLASGSADNTVKLWDVATGTLKTTLKGHAAWRRVAFSPDGATLASAGGLFYDYYIDEANQTVDNRIENLLEAQIVMKNYGNLPLEVIRTGNGLYITTYKSSIGLWDVASGKLKATLEGHTGYVNSVVFSPDGTTLASGSDDNTVKLWDITRQPKAPKATLSDHGGRVLSVYFSPDGTTLASGSADGAIRMWKALPPANKESVFTLADLVEVAENFGQVGENDADINGDGIVNLMDLVLVAAALDGVAGAPAINSQAFSMFTAEEVSQWLIEARHLQTKDSTYLRGILVLEQLLAILKPKETALLANYPNPFNPETWIPYQLATPVDVTVTIYDINGSRVRTLILGHQPAGVYHSQERAASWDGRNAQGEPVASGVYFLYAHSRGICRHAQDVDTQIVSNDWTTFGNSVHPLNQECDALLGVGDFDAY